LDLYKYLKTERYETAKMSNIPIKVRDLIYYQYAKIIVRRAFGAADVEKKVIECK
jgi:hypothetical protein